MTRIVIIGGGPAGYEAALVAKQYGADVALVEREGVGGACVLHDCVPSKTLIASADMYVELSAAHKKVKSLAAAQSADVRNTLENKGVRIYSGHARFCDRELGLAAHRIAVDLPGGQQEKLEADVVLIAAGASPRVVPDAQPDGERILNWRQIYDLPKLPEHLVVVGSGVTGAEFASAYTDMGGHVTIICSRDRVLPGEDADAAKVLEDVFAECGTTVVKNARAGRVERVPDGVVVHLQDGRIVEGSHALMTVGSVPNTNDLGLEKIGLQLGQGGFIPVDRVSRTSVSGVYAAGDCTGVLMLASVAAMQGRNAMWHALGEEVNPIKLKTVAANVFTSPEIATVGVSQHEVEAGTVAARTVMMPLATNARAKMHDLRRGFVKLFCQPATEIVTGGVVVAPLASELILPITLAVQNKLTVEHVARTFSVYPSLSGSITEAARQLMHVD